METTDHDYLNETINFLREGFYNVNAIQGLIIALIAAFILTRWGRLWAVALGAAIVHLIANILIPVVANHADFKLPPIVEVDYWRYALVLFVGYIIVIAVFFFAKNKLLRSAH